MSCDCVDYWQRPVNGALVGLENWLFDPVVWWQQGKSNKRRDAVLFKPAREPRANTPSVV